MSWLRKNRYQGLFASLLMAVFFSSQAFSCCMVNQRLGQFLKSAWTRNFGTAEAHSCCPSAQTRGHKDAPDAGRASGGCCIQDANQKLPQMASEPITVPDLAGLFIAFVPMPSMDIADLPAPPDLRSGSSPPVYLTSLRLLI